MQDFISHHFMPSESPKILLIFLHGYNNTREDFADFYAGLQASVPGLLIVAPEGKFSSLKDERRKSWYKISGFDAEGKRFKEETTVEEIAQIYTCASELLEKTAGELNAFIDKVQRQYGLKDSQTYIGGFSQGAMLAIWTSLIRRKQIAGCFSLSGLAAANDKLDKQIKSHPPVFLLHGDKDRQVLFKCMDFTARWLEKENIYVETAAFPGLEHFVSMEEAAHIARILCRQF